MLVSLMSLGEMKSLELEEVLGGGVLVGGERRSCGAASNVLYDFVRCSSSSKIAATLPQR